MNTINDVQAIGLCIGNSGLSMIVCGCRVKYD